MNVLRIGLLMGLVPEMVQSATLQEIDVVYRDSFLNVLAQATDRVEVDFGQPIPRTVAARFEQPGGGVIGEGAIDPFGNLSLLASMYDVGNLTVQATISTTDIFNPFPTPMRATAQVIVDGGEMKLLGPSGTTVSVGMGVGTADFDPQRPLGQLGEGADFRLAYAFQLDLEMQGSFLSADLTRTGDPPDAAGPFFGVGNEVIVQPTVKEIDLGIFQPSETREIFYQAGVRVRSDGLSEIALVTYRDPLSVHFGTVTFSPVPAPVPLPGGLLALVGGLATLLMWRRR